MFFETERLPISAAHDPGRRERGTATAALDELLPYQRADFDGLFEAMSGLPVIPRLIDPPLREGMPDEEALLKDGRGDAHQGRDRPAFHEEEESLLNAIRGMHRV